MMFPPVNEGAMLVIYDEPLIIYVPVSNPICVAGAPLFSAVIFPDITAPDVLNKIKMFDVKEDC